MKDQRKEEEVFTCFISTINSRLIMRRNNINLDTTASVFFVTTIGISSSIFGMLIIFSEDNDEGDGWQVRIGLIIHHSFFFTIHSFSH